MEDFASSEQPRTQRQLVVMGASAGGVETLSRVVAGLPADLPAAVCVVLHIAPTSPSALAHILSRAGKLPCRAASDGDALRAGEILVAPPDRHLMIEDGRVRLTVGPRENGHRPAVDALFRSAAAEREGGVVGVILSGTRDDGAAGLAAIKSQGGAAIVQDPDDALYAGMPANAISHVSVDAIVPGDRIAETVAAIVRGEEIPTTDNQANRGSHRDPKPQLTSVCPECGGVLTEHARAGIPQWECHVGHRYAPQSLIDAQGDRVEMALWTAVRMLRDRSALLSRMADYAAARHQTRSAHRFRSQSEDARDHADLVLEALHQATATTLGAVSLEAEQQAAAEQAT